jgi:hypothetical protein
MSTFSTPAKIAAIGGVYYEVGGAQIEMKAAMALVDTIGDMTFTPDAIVESVATRCPAANTAANSFIVNAASTATAASTTTLAVSSAQIQIFTGVTTQTVVLPNATTLKVNQHYRVINKSSGVVTVNANGGGLVGTVASDTGSNFIVTNISTAAGTWTIDAGGGGGGGDAVLSAVQTFTEVNTFNKGTASTSSTTGTVVVSGGVGVSGALIMGTSSTASIGSNGAPDASSILDLTSTTRGVLLPRMTTEQRNAIASPATGLILYDSTASELQIRDSTQIGYYASYIPTNFVLASNVVTCTCANDFSVGTVITITNVNATGFSLLQGRTYTVATASGANFTFALVNADIGSAANTIGYIRTYKTITSAATFNSIQKGNARMLFYDDFHFRNTQTWTATNPATIALEGVGSSLISSNTINGVYFWTSPTAFPAGNYQLCLVFVKYGNRGLFNIDVSCGGGPYEMLIRGIDTYDPNFGTKVPMSLYFTSVTAGTIVLRITNVGKYGSSSGYICSVSQPFMLYAL